MDAGFAAEDGTRVPEARLSPVERRNLGMINDPALGGFRVEGRAPAPAARTAPAACAGAPAEDADDACRLGRVCCDVLEVSPDIRCVELGQNGPCATERVVVHADNPHFSTDGCALYSKDGTRLVKLVVPCEEYAVREGCREIGPRAFDSCDALGRVRIPDTVERVGRLAFAKSGVRFVAVPSSVKWVDEKAFYGCKSLLACIIPEGVEEVADEAFELSGLERAHLPASLRRLGPGAFRGTPAERAAHRGAVTVDAANPHLRVDAQGALYGADEFLGLLSRVADYAVEPGTARVAADACRRNTHLQRISLPEGLTEVGSDAFRGAKRLSSVDLPESLRRIGARAFMDTAVQHVRIGRMVEEIGDAALTVQGEGSLMRGRRPLRSLDLDPENPVFYLEGGILCERGAGEGDADKAVLYVGPENRVAIPRTVNRIAPYAFLGACDIDELSVHGDMHSICAGALSVARSIPLVRVEFPRPVDGCAAGEFRMPSLSARFRAFTDVLSTDENGTVFEFDYYDSWVSNTSAAHEFFPAAYGRLKRPVRLRARMRDVYLGIFERKQPQACRYFSEQGDMEAWEDLMEWGVLGMKAVDDELQRATEAGNAQATGCLLELKRRHGRAHALDLSV